MERELLFTPREQPFYKFIRNVSVAIGQYRTRDETSRSARYSRNVSRVQLVLNIISLFLCIMYAVKHSDDSFYKKGGHYTSILFIILILVRLVLMQADSYKEQYTNYMDETHLSRYEYHDEGTTQILYNTERHCYLLFYFSRSCLIFGPISFALTPVLLSWIDGAFEEGSNKELQSAYYMSMPFDYKHDIRNWLWYSVLELYQTSYITCVGMYYDQFMVYVAFHIQGHIQVCIHKLQSLHSDDVVLTPEEDDRVYEELKRIIDHHNFIIRLLERFKDAFQITLFSNYTYDALDCCLLMLLITSNWPLSGLKYGTFAVTIFCILVGETIVIENLSTAMSDLHEVIYTVPWTAMSQRNQKAVYVMLLVSQKEFVFKALGITNINLKAMASILKATLSYFIWLKTMAD